MVPKMVPKLVPKLVPSIVKKEHIFCSEIPFSILKDKSGDKSRDNLIVGICLKTKIASRDYFGDHFWDHFFPSESGSSTPPTI